MNALPETIPLHPPPLLEIDRIQKGDTKKEAETYLDLFTTKNIKLKERVLIPVKQYPKVSLLCPLSLLPPLSFLCPLFQREPLLIEFILQPAFNYTKPQGYSAVSNYSSQP